MRNLIDLVERAQPVGNSEAFLNWFQGSVVVDDQGQPLVLYHGTAQSFDSFKSSTIWGSAGADLANEYAAMRDYYGEGGGNVVPVYMRITKPFDADLGLSKAVTVGEFLGAVMEQGLDGEPSPELSERAREIIELVRDGARTEESGPHYDRHDFWLHAGSMFGMRAKDAIREFFDLFGFDGIKMVENGSLTYGAFSSSQVKSIFNNGSYDPNSENISEERLDESSVRIGNAYIRRLQNRAQLINLLTKSPLGALRGWVCGNGEVWVWDAMDWSHGFAGRHIPGHENPIYFWNHAAPAEEFEQNGGKESVMDCGPFLFDASPFNREESRQTVLAKSPLLRKLIGGN